MNAFLLSKEPLIRSRRSPSAAKAAGLWRYLQTAWEAVPFKARANQSFPRGRSILWRQQRRSLYPGCNFRNDAHLAIDRPDDGADLRQLRAEPDSTHHAQAAPDHQGTRCADAGSGGSGDQAAERRRALEG